MEKIKCPICGIERNNEYYEDCPYCGWGYIGTEDLYEEEEMVSFNGISVGEAKRLLNQGLSAYGEPLPRK